MFVPEAGLTDPCNRTSQSPADEVAARCEGAECCEGAGRCEGDASGESVGDLFPVPAAFARLVAAASPLVRPMTLSTPRLDAATVAAAIESSTGRVYTGVCIDLSCGIGFCAEHAAVAEMIKHGEKRVQRVVAVARGGEILPPCGRCRELLVQVDFANAAAEVLLPAGQVVTLEELLPSHWLVGRRKVGRQTD